MDKASSNDGLVDRRALAPSIELIWINERSWSWFCWHSCEIDAIFVQDGSRRYFENGRNHQSFPCRCFHAVSGVWWDGLCKTFARVEQSSTAQNQILNLHMFIQSSDFLVFLCPSNCPVPLSRSRCLFLLVPLHLRRQTSEAGCHAPQVAPLRQKAMHQNMNQR